MGVTSNGRVSTLNTGRASESCEHWKSVNTVANTVRVSKHGFKQTLEESQHSCEH